MRKNTARHWLHAALDLLPVLLIPVFMIYSHRHTIDSGSIQVPQNQVVDFNQQIDFTDITFTSTTGVTFEQNENTLILSGNSTDSEFVVIQNKYDINVINGNKYVIFGWNGGLNTYGIGLINDLGNYVDVDSFNSSVFTSNYTGKVSFMFVIRGAQTFNETLYFNLIDLTQMFGSGNEPTLTQFRTWYDENFYSYTLSHKELLKDYTTFTYDDTDIMSQAVYQLYNSVDKYFNMNNVFNMGAVYDWFNLNIFSGNSPISIYIVWNIVLYEFVMDLLFLLYALFMWFIDMLKRLMEKPLDSIK